MTHIYTIEDNSDAANWVDKANTRMSECGGAGQGPATFAAETEALAYVLAARRSALETAVDVTEALIGRTLCGMELF